MPEDPSPEHAGCHALVHFSPAPVVEDTPGSQKAVRTDQDSIKTALLPRAVVIPRMDGLTPLARSLDSAGPERSR